MVAVTGAPNGGYGSILLVDDAYYQDVRLTCDATLGSGCDNAGLVFGYLDADNYWVKVYSNTDDTIYIYEINGGTWTQRSSTAYTITDDSQFTMAAEVRAGAADTYAGTVPSGQVGIWCSDSSDNDFDDFQVRDIAGPFEVDGRYFCSNGAVRTDNSDNNVIEAYGTDGLEDCIVRRAFRGDKFVFHFAFKWNNDSAPGCLVRWVSPGDYLALAIDPADDKTRLYKRQSDGTLTTLSTANAGLNLTTNTTYEAKLVIADDPGDPDLQQLSFTVDTDGDGVYSDETVQITSTAVDDVWSAGYVGLYRAAGGSSAQQYDDVLIGYDNNDDGDIADAGDDVQVADLFSSNAITLTYDNDGNLTADGLLGYVYDGWNRLVEVERSAAGDTTTVAAYAYDGQNRRVSKVIANNGTSGTPNDSGNATIHFYYDNKWRILETRNGSNQTTRQWVWGTKYTDEILFMDVNGDPTSDNDCDPDSDAANSRYFYHQDRNWNVVALTEYDTSGETDGRIVERYAYTPYGQFLVLKGDTGSGELANALHVSSVGNPFTHQGLGFDHEKSSYQNRYREYVARLQRFGRRDSAGYRDGLNSYTYADADPVMYVDPIAEASKAGSGSGGSDDTCVIRLRCDSIEGAPFGAKHCQWEIASSASGPSGECVCGPTTCPDEWWTICCFFDCLSCHWYPYHDESVPMGYGEIDQERHVPESKCECLREKCSSYEPASCYGVIFNNSNTGAGCLGHQKGCDLPFGGPVSAIGWPEDDEVYGEPDCWGMSQ